MNEITINTANQTPIEIALGIDEEGMTTARKLYSFLELRKADFARWAKTNITENEFATENEDYWRLFIDAETPTGGKIQREDFRLTAHFAKKLSVKGNSEKAEEAREYFTRLEEKVKQQVIDYSKLSPELQMFNQIFQQVAKTELEQKKLAERADQQEKNMKAIIDTFKGTDSDVGTEKWVNRCISKIAESDDFTYSFGNKYAAARNESYRRLSDRAGCRLDQQLRNAISRAEERGCTKAQTNQINKLSVIMQNKRLKEIYVSVIKEMMIAYRVEIA
jgi:anti-repressor protein|nr:MAG TPA: AntA/AntB antirepressor [Bacteriophage sp.]